MSGMEIGTALFANADDMRRVFDTATKLMGPYEDDVETAEERAARLAARAMKREDDPHDVQAAKRATLPPPSKHDRQRATIDRDAFAAKRDARRRMAKTSRRANR